MQVPNPLGPVRAIGFCRNCRAVDTQPATPPVCPVCGATPQQRPPYDLLRLSEPLGFRTWFGSDRDFGVPQIRPRAVLVAVKAELSEVFARPESDKTEPPTVGDCLFDLMAAKKWHRANAWKEGAAGIAPAIVGGLKKHGGPDLAS